MPTPTLQRQRPKDESADAIRGMIATLATERATASLRVTDETDRRAVLVRSGSAEQVLAAEEAVHLAEIDLESVDARLAELAPKLAAALGRERLAHVEALRVEAEAKAGRFLEFWGGRYEALAREIAAGLELETAARTAAAAFSQAAAHAEADPNVQAAGGVPVYTVADLPWAARWTCLPAVKAAQPPIAWPLGYSLTKPKVVGEAALYAK